MKKIEKIFLQLKSRNLKKEFKIIWKFFYNNAWAYIFLYLQNFLINRYMPSVFLGKFSYAQAMLQLFSSVYSMEVYSVYLRYIGFNNEKTLLHTTRRILALATILFSATTLFFFHSPIYILFFGYMWMRERLYFFRAKLDITTYGRIKIFQYLGSTFLLVLLILSNRLNEETMLACMGISYLIVSFIYSCNKTAKKAEISDDGLTPVNTKEIICYALPLSFNAIVVWLLGTADQMLIDAYLDNMTLTYYSVAFRIIGIIRIGTGVMMEYWPRFYFERMEARDYLSIKTMKAIFLGLVSVLCIFSILMCKQIYFIMGASQYSDMRWMFCMLAAAELFRQCGAILMTFQSYIKNTSINVTCLAILGGLKLLINWLFLHETGVSILFYTTLGCYGIYFLCSIYFGTSKERKYWVKFP